MESDKLIQDTVNRIIQNNQNDEFEKETLDEPVHKKLGRKKKDKPPIDPFFESASNFENCSSDNERLEFVTNYLARYRALSKKACSWLIDYANQLKHILDSKNATPTVPSGSGTKHI